mmetsp:Transcript_22206/g.51598  ORF Transcript_22206/g.51598 Transcript_22206/m.51598 type:complete len:406 (+) Transcript_22206:925-2142(+)
MEGSALGLVDGSGGGSCFEESADDVLLARCGCDHQSIEAVLILHVDVDLLLDNVANNVVPPLPRRLDQSRAPPLVHDRHVGPLLHQGLGGVLLTTGAGDNESSLPVLSHSIDVSLAASEKLLNSLDVSCCRRDHERGPSVLAADLNIHPPLDHLLHKVRPPLPRKLRQDGAPVRVLDVNVGPLLQQVVHDLSLAGSSGVQKGSPTIITLCLNVCSLRNQILNHLEIAGRGRQHRRRVPAAAGRLDVCALLNEELHRLEVTTVRCPHKTSELLRALLLSVDLGLEVHPLSEQRLDLGLDAGGAHGHEGGVEGSLLLLVVLELDLLERFLKRFGRVCRLVLVVGDPLDGVEHLESRHLFLLLLLGDLLLLLLNLPGSVRRGAQHHEEGRCEGLARGYHAAHHVSRLP